MSEGEGRALILWYDGARRYYDYESIEELKEYIQGCYPEISGYMILEEEGE